MVRIWYDNPDPAQPPDQFENMLHNFGTCGLFAEPMYNTTGKNHNFKSTYYQKMIRMPHINFHINCLPKKMLSYNNNWIRSRNSHDGSPVSFVPQKDGGLRLCIDYQTVNRITQKDRYPLTHIPQLVQPLGGLTFFSEIDLASDYHQIQTCATDRQKTQFSTKYRL
jgi:hypothetical protein